MRASGGAVAVAVAIACGTVDGIYHLVRAFKDAEIEHVEGSVDPVRDLEIISNELRLKVRDLAVVWAE